MGHAYDRGGEVSESTQRGIGIQFRPGVGGDVRFLAQPSKHRVTCGCALRPRGRDVKQAWLVVVDGPLECAATRVR